MSVPIVSLESTLTVNTISFASVPSIVHCHSIVTYIAYCLHALLWQPVMWSLSLKNWPACWVWQSRLFCLHQTSMTSQFAVGVI